MTFSPVEVFFNGESRAGTGAETHVDEICCCCCCCCMARSIAAAAMGEDLAAEGDDLRLPCDLDCEALCDARPEVAFCVGPLDTNGTGMPTGKDVFTPDTVVDARDDLAWETENIF